MTLASKLSENLRAILLMLLAMAAFAINDAFVKAVGNDLALSQVLIIRGIFATALLAIAATLAGQLAPLGVAFSKWMILRSCFEAVATVSFLIALFNMPFANVAAILQALPLTVTVGAALFFGEKIGIRRILAIFVGLVGVMLIIRPGTAEFNIYSILVLITVIAATCRDLISKRLDRSIPSLFVGLQTAVVVAGVGFVLLPFSDLKPVTSIHYLLLGCASLFLVTAYFAIVSTMRFGEVGVVAPFRYTVLLFSIVLGMAFFGEYPDWLTWLGSGIIVATGLYALYRDRKQGQHSHAKTGLGTKEAIR